MAGNGGSCPICKECYATGDQDVVCLRQKGVEGINSWAERKGDSLRVAAGDTVHKVCRKNYTKEQSSNLTQPKEDDNKHLPRSSTGGFDFKRNCFLCGGIPTEREFRDDVHYASCKNKELDTSIKQAIDKRANDSWGVEVKGRLEFVNDLRAVDALYHGSCSTRFRCGRDKPVRGKTSQVSRKRGHPLDEDREAAFQEIVNYLMENDDEQITISELNSMMIDKISDHSSAYTAKWLKSHLIEHFKDEIILTKSCGKSDVVTFIETATKILHEFKDDKRELSEEEEKFRIVLTAAKIVKSDIKKLEATREMYPTTEEMESRTKNLEYLPSSLYVPLDNLFVSKEHSVEMASIGQAIMQQVRPNSLLTPLQIGLVVQLHKHFCSRFLIDSLNKHGFSAAFTEVLKYEQCTAVNQGTNIPGLSESPTELTHFMQFTADNTDHNIRTLDGRNTFHGIGIIASITPKVSQTFRVPRLKEVTTDDLVKLAQIERHILPSSSKARNLKFKQLQRNDNDTSDLLTTVWFSTWLLNAKQPLWSGYMQAVSDGCYPGQGSVFFMPMIDLKSTDPVGLLSTMHFVIKQSEKYNNVTVLTFDQPLYWKSMSIKEDQDDDSPIKNCVIRLGGFHQLMSFLGGIGFIMQGSGLEAIFELVYAENSVNAMINGKEISRALRAHILVYGALYCHLMARMFDCDLSNLSEQDNMPNNEFLRELCSLASDSLTEGSASKYSSATATTDLLISTINSFFGSESQSNTAKLWIKYLKIMEVCLLFLKAERTGDWKLHLDMCREMLPYFAASGHYHYLKSVYLYLQEMSELEQTNPILHAHFSSGNHVVRRSDRFWAGLSTDLIIEQVLMRSLKTSGGLTRGRGMTERQRAIWLLYMPATAEVNRAMQELTSITFYTSDQHKDASMARITRDHADGHKILAYIKDRDPFTETGGPVNLATSEVADDEVNVHKAHDLGEKLVRSMADVNVFNFAYKKKDRVIQMKTKSMVSIEGEQVHVDSALLFQRLIAVYSLEELSTAFGYELSSQPMSLFNKEGLMNEADKPKIKLALKEMVGECNFEIHKTVKYVLDGGFLLHKVQWSIGQTFQQICDNYNFYIKKRYGEHPTIVFDGGYLELSTKDTTHNIIIRGTKGRPGKTVRPCFNNQLTMKKSDFLLSNSNKQAFLPLLGSVLENSGMHVIHAQGDADLLIVQTALETARHHSTVLIGEDTDLLILALYHFKEEKELYFTCEPKDKITKPEVWNIGIAKRTLGKLYDGLLVVHAISGCDTTSRIHTVVKGAVLRKYKSSKRFQQLVEVFTNEISSKEAIIDAGEKMMLLITGGTKRETTMNELRMVNYYKKLQGKTAVKPQVLGPTSDATAQHSLRVYHQVQTWKGRNLEPQDWGWVVDSGKLMPVKMTLPPAPQELLKIIRCSCKGECTGRCTCLSYGLKCTTMCTGYRGDSCKNCVLIDIEAER